MITKFKTEKSFDEIVSKVEEVCKENKFGVLKVYEFHELLKEKGFPIEKRITAFEICNPSFAQQVLTENSGLANFMPCKITVVEENGNVEVSIPDINQMLKFFEGEKVKEIGKEVQKIINNIVEELIK
ncbi:DUF302 domain-containing protein [Hydrogenivirga sp. 128-5-R1-1]|uniref:DUF302 domain-containing protein n=1 Tax=Hydrogenivirga sp. 128-5-R1-1 TaxID=392423 RepID=UPI00015EF9DB|nr:DUF302 domain-containing protein [Hydrogenivirga sp. 128-5-R1-1]EDP73652.1 hypothetical protein HG1285_04383 [Hydrogenivirga sp. 128-5-R1-1]